jgi:hypothetical protein
MKSVIFKASFCLWVSLFVCFTLGQASDTSIEHLTFDQKLSAPQKFSPAGGYLENVFEKVFRTDTGETNLTRRTEFDRTISLGATDSTSHLRFDFDLSAWPKDLRPQARMWIAVGTTNAISTDGDLRLTFSQSGAGMTTGLNDTYNVDGTMVLGCDYAATNGEVTVAIKNRTDVTGLPCSIHATVYLPAKRDPANLPQPP